MTCSFLLLKRGHCTMKVITRQLPVQQILVCDQKPGQQKEFTGQDAESPPAWTQRNGPGNFLQKARGKMHKRYTSCHDWEHVLHANRNVCRRSAVSGYRKMLVQRKISSVYQWTESPKGSILPVSEGPLRNTEERRYTRMATDKRNKLPFSRHRTKAELIRALENVYRRLQKQGFTEDQLEYLF